MRRLSRQILIGALTVIFLSSACGRLSFASPTPVWTLPPGGLPVFPTTTLPAPVAVTGSAITAEIPITGENVVSLQCQFCVNTEAHAVLIFPESVKFDVSNETPVSCLTAAAIGGKRILICHGTQSSTFNLNICTDKSNCLQFPVALQPCPLLQAGATPLATGTPFYLTPINTLKAPTKDRGPTATAGTPIPASTPTPRGIPATATPAANTPTSPPPASTATTAPQSTSTPPPPPPTSTTAAESTSTPPSSYTGNLLINIEQLLR
jgi:hypothetical protein